MLVELRHLAPGAAIELTNNYYNFKQATFLLYNSFALAQFLEIDGILHTNWQAGDIIVSQNLAPYCVMNLADTVWSFAIAYSDKAVTNLDIEDYFREIGQPNLFRWGVMI